MKFIEKDTDTDDSSTDNKRLSNTDEPITFAVFEDITNDEGVPQFSVWWTIGDDIDFHVPIYQCTVEPSQTFYSMAVDYNNSDYTEPTDTFWWVLKASALYWSDSNRFVKQLWDDLAIHEQVFFNGLMEQVKRNNVSDECKDVLWYARNVFGEDGRVNTELSDYDYDNLGEN